MDLGDIKVVLAAAVRAEVPSLACFGYVPDSIPEPCFFVGEAEIEFDKTFGRGLDEVTLTCRLLVSRSDDRSGQAALDRYLSGSGPRSIKRAIETARGAPGEHALGGLADDLHLMRVQAYRMYQVGEHNYYGAELMVRVIGEG
ncbi:hypothetical protein OG339_42240 [Streptosporangium sp. NBC_01495]|uniref:hypothetical protein n=1 Tax=Streptosporangium sp. NBC_01495 TaxID=2903899 RepID=UPI002E32CA5C|nr:hypothetical protein [Streptosporangium sp. NBC_01495]